LAYLWGKPDSGIDPDPAVALHISKSHGQGHSNICNPTWIARNHRATVVIRDKKTPTGSDAKIRRNDSPALLQRMPPTVMRRRAIKMVE
jgi:hypothetical protein